MNFSVSMIFQLFVTTSYKKTDELYNMLFLPILINTNKKIQSFYSGLIYSFVLASVGFTDYCQRLTKTRPVLQNEKRFLLRHFHRYHCHVRHFH